MAMFSVVDTGLGTMNLLVGALPVDPNLKVLVQPEAILSQFPSSARQWIAAGDRPQHLILQSPLSQVRLLPLRILNQCRCHHAPRWQAQTLAPVAPLGPVAPSAPPDRLARQ